MKLIQKTYPLNRAFVFSLPHQKPFNVDEAEVILLSEEETIIECRLGFEVTPALYQTIVEQGFFHYQPAQQEWQVKPEQKVNLVITLQPHLLSQLLTQAHTGATLYRYFLSVVMSPDHWLSHPDHWWCLWAEQDQQCNYTFWFNLSPAQVYVSEQPPAMISQGITDFSQRWKAYQPQQQITQLFESINPLLTPLATSEQSSSEATPAPTLQQSTSIFTALINFFLEDNWPFKEVENTLILETMFKGNHGEWFCYAHGRDETQQLVFYSVCPILIPPHKRNAIAEFLARANYGLVIGNFELDFRDGEVRYKTSLDTGGGAVTFDEIKSMIYTNVMMMDEYLPGMITLLEQDISPEEAMQEIALEA